MNTYPATSILAGVSGSLKEIDPLDSVGDGSGLNLAVGDRAWVPNYLGKMLFYSLEEESGHSDNGEIEVIPEKNPGNFYWKRQGYTKNTFSGAFTGEDFNVPTGSPFVPVGFTGAEMSYIESSYQVYGPGFPSSGPWYYASALYDGKIFVVTETDIYKMDILSEQLTITPHAGGGDWYWNSGHSDLNTSDSAKYLSHVSNYTVAPVVLNRLNMATETVDSISVVLPGGWTWAANYGTDRTGNSIRVGNYHYLIGGENTNRTGCSKIDVNTGDLTQLANIPGAGAYRGLCCPDFQDNCIYYHSNINNAPLYRYNIDTDTHDTLWTVTDGGNAERYYISWFDNDSNSIIMCTYNDLRVYDITLQTVTVYPATWNTSQMNDGFTLFYQTVGSFQFLGVWRQYSPGFFDQPSAHIPAVNPLRIIKN